MTNFDIFLRTVNPKQANKESQMQGATYAEIKGRIEMNNAISLRQLSHDTKHPLTSRIV